MNIVHGYIVYCNESASYKVNTGDNTLFLFGGSLGSVDDLEVIGNTHENK